MADREPLKATFHALKPRGRGGVLAGASAVYLVLTSALIGGFLYLNWGSLGSSVSWIARVAAQAESGGDPASVPSPPLGVFTAFFGYLLLLFPLYLVMAAYEAACLRWFLHGERHGLFGMNLGADAWRCYGGYWVWFGLNLLSSIVIAVIAFGVALMIGGASSLEDRQSLIEAPLQIVAIYFFIRLAPANATSIGLRRFAFFKAWTVTRERFLTLLGSYALIALLYLLFIGVLISVAVAVLWPALSQITPGMEWSEARPLLEAALTTTTIAVLSVLGVLLLLGGMVLYVLHFGICARAVEVALQEGKIEPEAASP